MDFLGDGNWYVDGGILYENRGGTMFVHMYDFGNTNAFELYVDTGWQGNLNDLAGFVFNLDQSMRPIGWFESTIHKVTWEITPTGRIEVATCNPNGCRLVAHDDSADLYVPANETFVSWGFTVQGQNVNVIWNGQTVFSQTVTGLPSAGTVGLYSNDNDGGVIYDNFCVYTSQQ